jgi:hypothetical protein
VIEESLGEESDGEKSPEVGLMHGKFETVG